MFGEVKTIMYLCTVWKKECQRPTQGGVGRARANTSWSLIRGGLFYIYYIKIVIIFPTHLAGPHFCITFVTMKKFLFYIFLGWLIVGIYNAFFKNKN